MKKFVLVNSQNLSPELFKDQKVWAQYYSPDDIQSLVKDGFDKKDIVKALEKVDYSDDYLFPVANRKAPYKFIYHDAKIYLQNNIFLQGYLHFVDQELVSISIFIKEEYYTLNQKVPEATRIEEGKLCFLLNLPSIYPLIAVSGREKFTLYPQKT